ncbi:MAG: beta strand repeat-containing protein, partial [Fluviibacter sp.]
MTLSNLTTAAFNSAHVANASNVTVGNLALATVAGNHTSALSDYNLQTTNLTWNSSTISAANLTLATTGNVTKTYDGTANASVGLANLSITGLVAGDSLTLSNLTTAAFNSAHVANASNVTVGNLALATVAGNHTSALSDYNLQTTNLTWNSSTISAANLTLSATGNISKVYDGSANISITSGNYSVSGLIAGDTLTLSNLSAAYNSAHVANASNVSINNLSLASIAGNSASATTDYNLQTTNLTWGSGGQAGTNANITAATLTLAAAGNVSRAYDGTANATLAQNNYQITGLVSGDTAAALTNTGATYNSAHVADATTVNTSGIAIANITGNRSSQTGDYVLSTTNLTWGSGGQAGTNANISAANLTLATIGNVTKTYDGTANATVS